MESGESPPKRRKGEEGYPGTPQVADYLYPQPSYFNNNPGAPDTVNYATGNSNGGSQHTSAPGTPTFPAYQPDATNPSFNVPQDTKPSQMQLDAAAQYMQQQQQQQQQHPQQPPPQQQQQQQYPNYPTNPMYSNQPGPGQGYMPNNQNMQQQQAPQTQGVPTQGVTQFKSEETSQDSSCKEEFPSGGVASSCSFSNPTTPQQQSSPMWGQQFMGQGQGQGYPDPSGGGSQLAPYHSNMGQGGPGNNPNTMMSSPTPYSTAANMNSYSGGGNSNGYPSPVSSIMAPPPNNMPPHNPMQDYYGQNHHPGGEGYIGRSPEMYNQPHDPYYSESRKYYNSGDMYNPMTYPDNAIIKHEPNNYTLMNTGGGYNHMGGPGGGMPPQHPYMYNNYNGPSPHHPHQMAPAYQYIPPSPTLPLHEQYIQIEMRLCQALSHVMFGPPVTHIYNPLDYAMDPHKCYLQKYCQTKKDILFLGMNPGPYGMAQTGVPFGEVKHAKDWLGVSGTVKTPQYEHPKKPILGFDCSRREVSGDRFWGYFKRLCIKPENFFRYALVHNICPLLFMNEKGKNLTPADLKLQERKQLNSICGKALCDIVTLLNTKVVIGVGRFSEERAKVALKDCGIEWVKVTNIMHPSPANPAANKGWDNIIEKQLEDMGLINYFRASKEDIAEEEERLAAVAAAAANNNNTVDSGAGDNSSTAAGSSDTAPSAASPQASGSTSSPGVDSGGGGDSVTSIPATSQQLPPPQQQPVEASGTSAQ